MSIQASSGSMPLSCMQQVSFNEDKTDGTAAMAPVPNCCQGCPATLSRQAPSHCRIDIVVISQTAAGSKLEATAGRVGPTSNWLDAGR